MRSITDISHKYCIASRTLLMRIKKHSIIPFYYKGDCYLTEAEENEINYDITFKNKMVIFQKEQFETFSSKMNLETE